MSEDFKVRKAGEADVDSIKDIETVCGLAPWKVEDYKNEVKREDALFIVAEKDKRVVGFLLARLITNQHYINNNKIDSTAQIKRTQFEQMEIYNIGIYTEYRKKGIGSCLLSEALKDAEAYIVKEIWLDVRESNKTALQFYRNSGFIKEYIRENYYTSPCENALVLKLNL